MEILSSKWIIALIALVAILLILFILGRKSVHSELIIPATPEEVWSVLMDATTYQEWNPVLIPIEGELREGAKLKYEFRQDENTKSEIPSTVKKMVRGKLLNQGGGMPGILTFHHKYILEKTDSGTRVTIHEDYRGIGVPFWNPTPVEKAYVRLNLALKQRVIKLKYK